MNKTVTTIKNSIRENWQRHLVSIVFLMVLLVFQTIFMFVLVVQYNIVTGILAIPFAYLAKVFATMASAIPTSSSIILKFTSKSLLYLSIFLVSVGMSLNGIFYTPIILGMIYLFEKRFNHSSNRKIILLSILLILYSCIIFIPIAIVGGLT